MVALNGKSLLLAVQAGIAAGNAVLSPVGRCAPAFSQHVRGWLCWFRSEGRAAAGSTSHRRLVALGKVSSANVNVVLLTRKSLDPASGTPSMSNELLHLRLM